MNGSNSAFPLLIIVIIAFVLGLTIGNRKRIGSLWTIFFLLFGLLPGIIALILSPPLKNLPPEKEGNKTWNIILGIIAVLAGFGFIKEAMEADTYFNENAPLQKYVSGGFFICAAIYMFMRSDRNKRMYNEQELRKWKKVEDEGLLTPSSPPNDLDTPIYDQV
jgi:hypothetical protein